MTILTVRHLTTYSYAAPVRLGEHRMMLRPRDSNDQRLLKASLEIEPRPQRPRWIHDVFDNCVAIADFSGETRRLDVVNAITIEHIAPDEPAFRLEDRARTYPFSYDAEDMPKSRPGDRAALPRPLRRPRALGPTIRQSGATDRDGHAAHDPDQRDQGRPRP